MSRAYPLLSLCSIYRLVCWFLFHISQPPCWFACVSFIWSSIVTVCSHFSVISAFYSASYKLIPNLFPVGLGICSTRLPSFLFRNEAKVNVNGSVRCLEFVFLEEWQIFYKFPLKLYFLKGKQNSAYSTNFQPLTEQNNLKSKYFAPSSWIEQG